MHAAPADGFASALRSCGIGSHPREWRVPPIETWPRVVAFAQTLPGKLVLFVLFAALMKFLASGLWLWVTAAAAVVSLATRHRRHVALACTALFLVVAPEWFEFRAVYAVARAEGLYDGLRLGVVRAATLVACVPLAMAALWLARHYRDHPLGRRPVLAQHLLFFGLLAAAMAPVVHGLPLVLLWSAIAVFAGYFWFLAFALIDQRHRQPAPFLFHFVTFHPFFANNTTVPMGKGAANLASVEARDDEALAVTQLKGLKLLGWAFFLKALLWVYRKIVYAKLGVPPLGLAFERFVTDGVSPGALGSASIVANFFEQLLLMAIWGHVVVATARLAGYRLLRNTCRPLSSRNVAEFWNRYFYYFKEMLVHVYFYPTYVRWFKRHPRLRIAFATFVAAGLGNFFCHFLLEGYRIPADGLRGALASMQTYAFYCTMLVGGIVLSQLRARRPDPNAAWWRRQLVPSLGVALFYGFLSFFDGPQRHVALGDHFAFLFEVLGGGRWK